jgi:hypothetical protein
MWQPIASAPQTVPILGAWRDEDGWHFAEVYYRKGEWLAKGDWDDQACKPTLWAPLPVGP